MDNSIPQDCNPPLKQCLACKEYLPATVEFFHRYKAHETNFRPRCKTCVKSRKEPVKDTIPEGHKRCILCGEIKLATVEFFHRYAHKSDGLHNSCKECLCARRRQYTLNHGERERASSAAYKQTNAEAVKQKSQAYKKSHKQEIRDSKKAYVASNREKVREGKRRYRETHQDYVRKYERNYAQTHREQQRAKWRNRRARERNAPGNHTSHDVQLQYERQRKRCYYCKRKLTNDFHVDHIIPLSKCGTNDPSNLVIACSTCNLRKHNKLPHEWPEGGRLL